MSLIFRICFILLIGEMNGLFVEVLNFTDAGVNQPHCGLGSVPKVIKFNKKCFRNNYADRMVVVPIQLKDRIELYDNISSRVSSRIMNGRSERSGESPWTVYLATSGGPCTGTLITLEWVLTSAHCLQAEVNSPGMHYPIIKKELKLMGKVYAGYLPPEKDRYNWIQAIDVNVGKIVLPAYRWKYKSLKEGMTDPEFIKNDIGLVKLHKKFELLSKDGDYQINTVCLPKASGLNVREEEGTFTGYGRLKISVVHHEGFPTRLQIGKQVLEPSKDCPVKGLLCAIEDTNQLKGCPGDSGAPLVQYTKDKDLSKAIIIGVFKFSRQMRYPYPNEEAYNGCNELKTESLFVPPMRFIPWILEAIGGA